MRILYRPGSRREHATQDGERILHFEPSLAALILRSDVISSMKILYRPGSGREHAAENGERQDRRPVRARGSEAPHTLHPTPFTLHPSPYTLHPSPYTLHPTPYTLHPKA